MGIKPSVGYGISNLCFHYPDGKKVFDRLNLSFKKGKINYIVGNNGFGKSTELLSFLSGDQHVQPQVCEEQHCLCPSREHYLYGEHIGKMMDQLSAMQENVYVIIVTHNNRVMLRCSAVVDLQAEC